MAQRGTRAPAKQREVGNGTGTRTRGRSAAATTAAPEATIADLPMLRTSERGTLKRCEFLWDLTYNRKLKPLTDMPALRYGSLVHQALADYYPLGTKRGTHPAKAFKKHYDADMKRNREIFGMKVDEDEKWVNAEELGIAMLENYVDEYGSDPDWEVLATEMPFQVVVERRIQTPPRSKTEAEEWRKNGIPREPWFLYVGVVDGVWKHRRTREIWIPDHKTTNAIYKKLGYLQMDDQAGAYWSFGVEALVADQLLKRNQQLNGMLYNFLRKAMPDERASKLGANGQRIYLNKDGSESKKQPSPYFLRQPIFRDAHDRNEAVRRAVNEYRRIEMLRAGELEVTKNPGMFTCPMCPLSDICELHETGHDYESVISAATQTWDPYDAHEIYDGR